MEYRGMIINLPTEKYTFGEKFNEGQVVVGLWALDEFEDNRVTLNKAQTVLSMLKSIRKPYHL